MADEVDFGHRLALYIDAIACMYVKEFASQCKCIYFSSMPMPTETTVQTWILVARAYGAAITKIENALAAESLPPLIWYDILIELEREKHAGLRQYELEQALLLKQYSVSRLVERIEKEGYLRREPSKTDGRGKRMIITSEGVKLRQRMWLIYGPKIQEAFGQKLTEKQCNQLGSLMAELATES
jgi:DNA-binding MarR family transcriptional regulator